VLVLQVGADALHHLAVIDRVANIVAGAGTLGVEADLEIEIQRLRTQFFPLVNADPGIGSQFADENRIQMYPCVAVR